MKTEYTREQYMNRECTHAEYYGQFVTEHVKKLAIVAAGGVDRIKASNDPYFNDIPLLNWDAQATSNRSALSIPGKLDGYGTVKPVYSLGNAVCILKEAARQIKEAA